MGTPDVRSNGQGATAPLAGRPAFLTYKEFAYEARISPSTVRKYVREGGLRVARIGRAARIPRSELDRLAAQAEHGAA